MSTTNQTPSAVKKPSLPEEVVEVPELGMSVKVRGLKLSERLDLALKDGEGFARIARMLSYVVLDVTTGQPLFTADEWEAFGGNEFSCAMGLWAKAQDLSGLAGDSGQKKN